MRAAILREYGEPLDIHEVPDPNPARRRRGPRDGLWRLPERLARVGGPRRVGRRSRPRGQVLGHEPAGEVVTVGDPSTGSRRRPRRRSVLARRRHLSALSAGTRERL